MSQTQKGDLILPNSLDGHEKRISRLEERDKTIDGRIQNMHTKIDSHKVMIEHEMKGISTKLEDIQKGLHGQELINQKMDFTLESINRERQNDIETRKESRNDMKQIKVWVLGMVGVILSSLGWTLLRMWLGI